MTTRTGSDSVNKSPSRRLLLAWCCLGLMAVSLAASTPAMCLTSIAATFGFDAARSGLFLSICFWGVTVSMFGAGFLADRFGYRRPAVAGAVCHVLGFAAVGSAPTPALACAGAALIGLGSGLLDALTTPIVCAVYPNARMRVSNLLHAFYPIGIVTAVLLITLLRYWGWHWRGVYLLMAALVLPCAIAFLVLRLPQRVQHASRPAGTGRLFRQRVLWLLAGAMFLGAVTELGPSQWLPAYVESAAGGTLLAGATGLMCFAVLMAIGRMVTSLLSRRLGLRQLLPGACVGCAILLTGAAATENTRITITCLALLGLCVAPLWPSILAAAGDRFPNAGAAMFSVLSTAGGLGGAAGPLIIGVVGARVSLRAGVQALAVAPVLAAIVLLVALRATPRHSPARQP